MKNYIIFFFSIVVSLALSFIYSELKFKDEIARMDCLSSHCRANAIDLPKKVFYANALDLSATFNLGEKMGKEIHINT